MITVVVLNSILHDIPKRRLFLFFFQIMAFASCNCCNSCDMCAEYMRFRMDKQKKNQLNWENRMQERVRDKAKDWFLCHIECTCIHKIYKSYIKQDRSKSECFNCMLHSWNIQNRTDYYFFWRLFVGSVCGVFNQIHLGLCFRLSTNLCATCFFDLRCINTFSVVIWSTGPFRIWVCLTF